MALQDDLTDELVDDAVLPMAIALVCRAAAVIGADPASLDVDADVIAQLDADLFEQALAIGDAQLDSLAVVELLDVIEGELDVSLFELDDIDEVATLRTLSAVLLDRADAKVAAEFIRSWRRIGPPPG